MQKTSLSIKCDSFNDLGKSNDQKLLLLSFCFYIKCRIYILHIVDWITIVDPYPIPSKISKKVWMTWVR